MRGSGEAEVQKEKVDRRPFSLQDEHCETSLETASTRREGDRKRELSVVAKE